MRRSGKRDREEDPKCVVAPPSYSPAPNKKCRQEADMEEPGIDHESNLKDLQEVSIKKKYCT